ncbi:MAG: pitrilysin family protein [Chthoniobacteraceae bacterium]|jgi:predicted Zn-dependent peptidase
MQYQLSTLSNGTRLATCEMPQMQSVALGFWAGVGGRFETKSMSGISHFVEHLVFKGTKQRTARQITEEVEGLGGYLNAFTTEDHTCYYAKAGGQHFAVLCDVLCDMYLNSTFDPQEIEKEREVIREEIMMYRDNPAQHAQELLSETMWPKHPLGQPLTGTVESISKFNRPILKHFMRENYNGHTTIVTAAGNIRHTDLVRELNARLGRLPAGRAPRYRRGRFRHGQPKVSLVHQATEQTHLAMGFYAFGRSDERRFALKLLSVILGENMSSRLFQRLREQYGFCYSVQTGMVALADAGVINIYAGLDTAKLQRAVRTIFREIEGICKKAPSRQELRKAQDYTVGQTILGLESTSNQMMFMGESILGYRKVLDPGGIEKKLMSVTPEDVRKVACHCLDRARLGLAVVGPFKNEEEIRRWVV